MQGGGVGADERVACRIIGKEAIMIPIGVLKKLGRRRVVFAQPRGGIKEGVQVEKVDPACGEVVDSPFGVLQRHGPADAMKAFYQRARRALLPCERSDGGRIVPVIRRVQVVYGVKRNTDLFVVEIAAGHVAIALGCHAHAGYLGNVGKAVFAAPARDGMVVVFSQHFMQGMIITCAQRSVSGRSFVKEAA